MAENLSNNIVNIYNDLYEGNYREKFSGFEIARYSAIKDVLLKTSPKKKCSVLDFGAGSGLYIPLWLDVFPEVKLACCDISDIGLKKIEDKFPSANIQCKQVINGRVDFPSDYFDVIVSIEVIEHVFDLHTFFEEIARLLKPQGLFIFTTPCSNKWSIEYLYSVITNQIETSIDGYVRWKWEDSTHIRRFNTMELKKILEMHGIIVETFLFRAHFFSFFVDRIMKNKLGKLGTDLIKLDYLLFRKLQNGASMIGIASIK